MKSAVAAYLNEIGTDALTRVTDLSVEKSTHYKWYLGGDQDYRVWLHQYRTPAEYAKSVGHAASIHNHRYPFCSRVIQGGLHTRAFRVTPMDKVEVHEERYLEAGDTMLLAATDVHQIAVVEEDTMTLVIQGPPQRSYSEVWTREGILAKRVFDLNHLYLCLKTSFGLCG